MTVNTPHNLLPLSKAFCGRDTELPSLFSAVSEHRVHQLTGPAGIGKTELARAVGHRARETGAFANGIFQVTMEDAAPPATLMGELVFLLGFDQSAGLEKEFIDQELLIIWDQMDTVGATQAEAAVTFFNETMAFAPGVHHLILCREPLADIPHTSLGPLDRDASAQAFAAFLPSTVSERPLEGDADFEPVLELLEGNPLALELAANWCHPPRWLDGLRGVLEAASSAPEGLFPGALGRTLNLVMSDLDDRSRRLITLLHAYPDGAAVETLYATFGEESSQPVAVIEKAALGFPVGERHYLHPAVRGQVAADADRHRADTFREQAAVFLHQMVNECRAQVNRGGMAEAIRFLVREWRNLRAAFTWTVARMEKGSIDVEEDCALVLDYCLALFHLFSNKLMYTEGMAWMEAAIQAGEELEHKSALALCNDYYGVLAAHLGKDDDARRAFTASLETFREMGTETGIASTAYHLALLEFNSKNTDAAEPLFEEVLPLLRSQNNRAFAAQTHTYLGQIRLARGDAEGAYEQLTEAINLYEERTVSVDLRITALFALAHASVLCGHGEEGVRRASEGLHAAFARNPRYGTAALPNLFALLQLLVGRGETGLVSALARALDSLMPHMVEQAKATQAKEWQLSVHLMDGITRLVIALARALAPEGEPGRAEARAQAPDLAREADTLTGRIMNLERWVSGVLQGP